MGWGTNVSGKRSQERLTRGTEISTVCEGSTHFWPCEVRCGRCFFDNEIPIYLSCSEEGPCWCISSVASRLIPPAVGLSILLTTLLG